MQEPPNLNLDWFGEEVNIRKEIIHNIINYAFLYLTAYR